MGTIQESARITVDGRPVRTAQEARAALERGNDAPPVRVEHVAPRTEASCRRLGLTVRRPAGRPPRS